MGEKIINLFAEAVQILNDSPLDYMIGGGVSLNYYGLERDTKDIDVFVSKNEAEPLLRFFEKAGWLTKFTDGRWLYQATKGEGVLSFKKNNTVDVIFRNSGPIDITPKILKHAIKTEFLNLPIKIPSIEDLVLFKIYSQQLYSQHHWNDAVWLLDNYANNFDWNYFLENAAAYSKVTLGFLLLADSDRGAVPYHVIKKIKDIVL